MLYTNLQVGTENIMRKSWLPKLKEGARKKKPDFERERSRGERKRQK